MDFIIEQGKSTEQTCPFPAAADNTVRQQQQAALTFLTYCTVQWYRFVCYEAYVLSPAAPSMTASFGSHVATAVYNILAVNPQRKLEVEA